MRSTILRGYMVLFCGLSLILAACGSKDKGVARKGPPPVPVITAKVVQKDTPHFLDAIGRVEAFQSVDIKPRVTGLLLKEEFQQGDDVRKGQLLFSIDPAPFEARLRETTAGLKTAKIELKHARVDLRRYEALLEQKMVTPEKFEQIQIGLKSKENQVELQTAKEELARLDLQYCSIRSPLDGRSGEIEVDAGNTVSAYRDRLVNIKQMQPITVTFSLPGKFLPEIKTSSSSGPLQTQALIPGSKKPEMGRLDLIQNTVNPKTGMIMLQAIFPNKDGRLWPGQFVKALLNVGVTKNAPLVSTQAVSDGPKGQYVWLVKKDRTVKMRPVVVGRRYEGMSVLSSGLKRGEEVVTTGKLTLHPGAKVMAATKKGAAGAKPSSAAAGKKGEK